MIDLKEVYGKCYKVTMDESWEVERQRKEEDRPWYYEIVGRLGMVYPHSDTEISIELTPRTWKKWEKSNPVPYTLKRICDEGPTLIIGNIHLNDALKWINPRRKRTLTPEHKAKLLEASSKYRFLAKTDGSESV